MKKAAKSFLFFAAVSLCLIAVLLFFRTVYNRVRLANEIALSKQSYDSKTVKQIQHVEAFVQNVVQKQPFQNMSTPKLLRAARVTHFGVPGKWTSDGRFIEGIRPNPKYAVPAYAELLKRKQYSILEDYAKLMEFGVPQNDHIINKKVASQLYQLMFSRTTDIYKKFDILVAIKRLSPAHEQHRLAFEQSQLAQEISQDAARRARNARHARERNRETEREGHPRARTILPRQNNHYNMTPHQDDAIWILPNFAFEDAVIDVAPTTIPRNDGQNVHDSTVVKTVKASVDRLRQAVAGNSQPGNRDTAAQIRHLIAGADAAPDKKKKAMQALDTIERNNQVISSTGTSELELLDLVWKRIHHEDNQNNGQVLRENLINELSDSIEHDLPVCSTGRFTHVLDTLNGVDELVQIKPQWALHKEIYEKTGVLFQEEKDKLPEADRIAVDAIDPTPEQQVTCDTIIDKIKTDIRDNFKTSYVDSGIMTQDALNVELSKFIDVSVA